MRTSAKRRRRVPSINWNGVKKSLNFLDPLEILHLSECEGRGFKSLRARQVSTKSPVIATVTRLFFLLSEVLGIVRN